MASISNIPTDIKTSVKAGTIKTITLTYLLTSTLGNYTFTLQGSDAIGLEGIWAYHYYKILNLDGLDFEIKDNADLDFKFDYDDVDFTNIQIPTTITFTKCPLTKIKVELYVVSGGFPSAIVNNEILYFTASTIRDVSDFYGYINNFINLKNDDLIEWDNDYIPLSTDNDSNKGIYGIYFQENLIIDFGDVTTTSKNITLSIPSEAYNDKWVDGRDFNFFITSNNDYVNIIFTPDSTMPYMSNLFELTITRYLAKGEDSFKDSYVSLNVLWFLTN